MSKPDTIKIDEVEYIRKDSISGAQGDKVKVKPMFAWYDFSVGVFYDQQKQRIYIFPLPMLGVMVQL